MLGVKESFKARNGNRGKRESRRRESSRAGDLSSSRSLKTLRKVWARVCARAGVCARAPYSQSPADMTSGMELLLEHTCGAEPLNQRQKTEELRSDVWIWWWGSSVKCQISASIINQAYHVECRHQFHCSIPLQDSQDITLGINWGVNINIAYTKLTRNSIRIKHWLCLYMHPKPVLELQLKFMLM